jgi:hypothetical protein
MGQDVPRGSHVSDTQSNPDTILLRSIDEIMRRE